MVFSKKPKKQTPPQFGSVFSLQLWLVRFLSHKKPIILVQFIFYPKTYRTDFIYTPICCNVFLAHFIIALYCISKIMCSNKVHFIDLRLVSVQGWSQIKLDYFSFLETNLKKKTLCSVISIEILHTIYCKPQCLRCLLLLLYFQKNFGHVSIFIFP